MARWAPSLRSRETSTVQASRPRSRSSRSKIVPPRMIASRRRWEPGPIALAHAGVDRGAKKPRLAGEVLRSALDQPRPVDVARELPRSPGWRQAGVVGGDHDLGVEALRRASQRRERVLARGAAVGVLVVEDVQLRGHGPAGEIAPPGGCGGEPRPGQERVRRREPARRGVDDHGHAAGGVVEALLESQPQVLEPVESTLGASLVGGLVTCGEAQRLGLDPGHPAQGS